MSRLSNARTELENYEKTRPADYVSQYQPKIKDVMGQLDGMKEFDYDPDADTAYQQYKSRYTRGAELASEDAAAQAAARSGGYGNSWGTRSGQTAYQNTMNGLASVADSLYNQAYNEYNTKKSDLSNQLGTLQKQDELARQEWQTNVDKYYNDLSYAQNEYNSAVNAYQQERSSKRGFWGSVLAGAAMLLPWIL